MRAAVSPRSRARTSSSRMSRLPAMAGSSSMPYRGGSGVIVATVAPTAWPARDIMMT